jgi:hypothetical protein
VDNTGALTMNANTILNKVGSGTWTQTGTTTANSNTTLRVGTATETGGTWNQNADAGRTAVTYLDASVAAASANLIIDVRADGGSDSSIVNLNANSNIRVNPLDALDTVTVNDRHNVRNITVDEAAAGVAQVVLGAGDPFGIGAGGTVLVQVYSGGTTSGSAPSRADTEALWVDIAVGYYAGGNGITTNEVTDPSVNGLAMLLLTDDNGASYNGLIENILGDVNADFFVDGSDISVILAHQDTTPGTLGGEGSYTLYTWQEGDINGDGAVDGADLATALANQDQGYNPGTGSGVAAVQTPEPASFALLGLGGMLLLGRRRKQSR